MIYKEPKLKTPRLVGFSAEPSTLRAKANAHLSLLYAPKIRKVNERASHFAAQTPPQSFHFPPHAPAPFYFRARP
jgi:hypothetical protein